MINYNGKVFKALSNSNNGDSNASTIFRYSQKDNIDTATYSCGNISAGNLIAKSQPDGSLDMLYQHINVNGEFRYGRCHSVPEIMPDGKIKLHESWQWLNGDCSSGKSVLIELPQT